MYILSKTFRFEMAHRLSMGYMGKCANVHGHSWNGQIVVDCESLDDVGMGIDYAELKKITKVFEDTYDHKLVLHEGDELVEVLTYKTELVLLEDNPTSEVLARELWNIASRMIARDNMPCKLIRIDIKETCTSECSYSR